MATGAGLRRENAQSMYVYRPAVERAATEDQKLGWRLTPWGNQSSGMYGMRQAT